MNGNGNRSHISIPKMAVEEGSGCTCTTDVVQFSVDVFGDPRPCEFELPIAGCCFHTRDRSRSRVSYFGVVASVPHSPRWWDDISSYIDTRTSFGSSVW